MKFMVPGRSSRCALRPEDAWQCEQAFSERLRTDYFGETRLHISIAEVTLGFRHARLVSNHASYAPTGLPSIVRPPPPTPKPKTCMTRIKIHTYIHTLPANLSDPRPAAPKSHPRPYLPPSLPPSNHHHHQRQGTREKKSQPCAVRDPRSSPRTRQPTRRHARSGLELAVAGGGGGGGGGG